MPEPAFEPVAVVGLGCVFPGARSADELWRNVCARVDAIDDVPAGRWDGAFYDPDAALDGGRIDRFYCRRGGFVDDVASFEPTAFGIMPVVVEGGEPDQFLALTQAAAALEDSGQVHERARPDRVGVIVGRGGYRNSGLARLDQRVIVAQQLVEALRALFPDLEPARIEHARDEFVKRLGPARPEASIGLVPNFAASRVANRLDLRGPAYTVDAACASALLAVDQAVRELASGRCDVVVAGGVHHCHDALLWSIFTQLRALSPTQSIRPFSQRADGVLLGEGTGFFVLERLADAERAGDRVYAVVRGSGVASDGRTGSLVSPDVGGQVLALERAWRSAGFDPATVGLVEAHGTATPSGDEAELETLQRVFGPANGTAPAGLGSIKSMIGHAMPAAGAAGLAKAALALHHRVLPPTLHAEEPHPALAATRFRLIQEAEPWEADGPRRAGVNAFGFGGINAHLVLEEHHDGEGPAPAPAAATASAVAGRAPAVRGTGRASAAPEGAPALPPTLLLAAEDTAGLAERLEAWIAARDRAPGPAPSIAEVPEGGPARLAIVDVDDRRLELARKVLDQRRPWRGRSGVWFEPHGLLHDGRLAFVFPGFEPAFEPRVDDVARHFGLQSLTAPLRPAAHDETWDLERQSHGIITVSRLLHRALGRLGIAPDMVAGHSFGEWAGALAAGVVSEDDVDELIDKVRPGTMDVGVVHLAVLSGVDTARELVAGLDRTVVSHDNCPHQSVVCGPPDEVAVAAERCQERRTMAQELPFRSGFHTPLFAAQLPAMRPHFDSLQLRPPAVPIWSATTCRPFPSDPDEFRELATRHLVEPVRFRELALALHDAGARVFLQAGTGSLTGWIEDTLSGHEAVVIAANMPKRSGLEQLCHVTAAVWVEGRDVAVEHLLTPSTSATSGLSATAAGSSGTRQSPPGRRPGPTLRLELGSRLVRDLTPLGSAPADGRDGQHPERGGHSTPPRHADPPEPEPRVWRRRFDLASEPAWADHTLFTQPERWPHPDDRFPIVPLTAIVEILAESAAESHPGLRPVAVEDVTALRWLVVAPPTEVTMRAVPQGTDDQGATRVRVTIDGHAGATVVLAPAYPPAPPAEVVPPLAGERPSHIPAERFYTDRYMFHGPAYQGVEEFLAVADDGSRALVRAPAAPGALLDNAAQILGHWLSSQTEVNRVALPVGITRVELFGPHPPVGTLVECTATVGHCDERSLGGDLFLVVDGRVWCRITGWRTLRFTSDPHVFEAFRWPERTGVSDERDGYTLVRERWPDTATRDMVMRRYLGRDERPDYERRHPLGQRQFLLGRIAVKDAVRQWLWTAGHGPLFPAEIGVADDHQGRPLARGPYTADLRVSQAHVDGLGAAVVAEGRDVGIDIEKVAPRRPQFEQVALTEGERRLDPPDGYDRDAWLTCLWAVKEAAARATGRGLRGRPQDFEITERRGSTARVGDLSVAFESLGPDARPSDGPDKEHIVAWTLTDR